MNEVYTDEESSTHSYQSEEHAPVSTPIKRRKKKGGLVWVSVFILTLVAIGIWVKTSPPLAPDDARLQNKSPYHVNKPQRNGVVQHVETPLVKDIPKVEGIPKVEVDNVEVEAEAPVIQKVTKKNDDVENEKNKTLETLERNLRDQKSTIRELSHDVRALQEKLKTTTKQANEQTVLLQHYTLLKTKITNGRPFTRDLNMLLKLPYLPDAAYNKLTYFKAFSKKGFVSPDALILSFDQSLRLYYRDGGVDDVQSDGAWEGVKRWMRSLIIIRKVGETHKEDTDDAILARAEMHIGRGNIVMALEEMNRLSVHTLPYFKAWQYNANAYVESYALLVDIESLLFQSAH